MDLKNFNKKKLIYSTVLLLTTCLIILIRNNHGEKKIQEDIAKEIIRFHVIANSDMEEDQKLKMKIKEKVVKSLQGSLKDANNIKEARKLINSDIKYIEKTAADEIKKEGYSYGVKAKLTKCYFPIKQYGDMVFPAGIYEALRVELGLAEGKNWWCVMFPTLCFVDGTYDVVPEESKKKLKTVLTYKEYNSLVNKSSDKVTIKFKLSGLWKRLWS